MSSAAVYARVSTRVSTPAQAAVALLLGVCVTPLLHAAERSGTAALTTDYVWRGTSQSQGDPAVQAGLKIASDRGVYAQAWGSSVEFAPDTQASSEVDLVVGWAGPLRDALDLDVNLTHYRYPATTVDLNWTEAIATLTWREQYWLQVGQSNDALASGAAGTHAQVGARWPLTDALRIEAAAGHYRLGRDSGYDDYSYAQLGGVWAFAAPFELRLTAYETDAAATRVFPGLAGSRVEAALQASF